MEQKDEVTSDNFDSISTKELRFCQLVLKGLSHHGMSFPEAQAQTPPHHPHPLPAQKPGFVEPEDYKIWRALFKKKNTKLQTQN